MGRRCPPGLTGSVREERHANASASVPPSAGRGCRRPTAPPRRLPLGAASGGACHGDRHGPPAESGAAARRACPPPPSGDRAAPQRRAPSRDGGGPRAPGAPRWSGPRLVAGTADRPAGDAAALAPRGVPVVPGAEVTPGARPPAAAGGHRRLDPADGGGQPALGRRTDPRRAREAGPARGQADRPNVPARGRRPAATRSGRATSSR